MQPTKHHQLAKANNLTPEHIAAKCGMTAQGVRKCLGANRVPTNPVIAKIYKTLLGLP